MPSAMGVSRRFLVEAVNVTIHVINRMLLIPKIRMALYKMWRGKKSTMSYFFMFFGSSYYILRDKAHQEKNDAWSDEGIFLGYSSNSKVFRALTNAQKLSWNHLKLWLKMSQPVLQLKMKMKIYGAKR